ncbi:amidohydrolase family protein [Phytohabitans rumicis]|uniref:5-methylthioadenosine/S-adenosylhomocysteine deaminase n=1 Tax=Phytohabitans rumicis TaxID=1076125 RepID=A0A6V8LNT2_9ACTN|nr:amidohydrolase family protein [Phytohabitans rumicis]GFJ96309.1 5-methylthioadenosine/S-adenosylhomocysteine deaminase [Phytohabitans rumicis]
MTEALLIRDGFVHTADPADTVHVRGSVLALDGRIAAVGPTREVDAVAAGLRPRTIDARGHLVLPGFVNPHWHEQFAAVLDPYASGQPPRGLVYDLDDRPGWMALGGDIQDMSVRFDRAYQRATALEPDEAEAIARYSLWTQLRGGTTTIGDVGSMNRPEAVVAAVRALGMRGVLSVWASDACCPPDEDRFRRTRDAGEVLARVEALLRDCAADGTGRIRAMPSVIYSPNMIDELGAGLGELARRFDTPLATHIGALRNEADVVRGYFGETPIRRFAKLGLLTDRLIAVHCAFADEEERRMLREARVHISHSPAKYGTSGESGLSGSRQIIELFRAGLDVSVSTDGQAQAVGGMPETMRLAWLGHNEVWSDDTAVRPSTALAMGTRLAARGLRWADQIGSLEPGKQADLVLVPATDWRYLFRPRPLAAFLQLGGSTDVDTVIVGGRVLLSGGRATEVDEDELRERFAAAVLSAAARTWGTTADAIRRAMAEVGW